MNVNHFTDLRQGYVCARCRGLEIDCQCGIEGDYRLSLARCTACGTCQHKRHAGLGFGVIPSGYVCRKCRKNGHQAGSRTKRVEATIHPSDIPKEVDLRPVANCAHRVPPGRLATRLAQFNSRVDPVDFISILYSEYRDTFFRVHPTLKLFKYLDFKPKEYVTEVDSFFYFFVRAVSFMTGLTTSQTVTVLNHLMTIDIYRKAAPPVKKDVSEHPLPQLSKYQRHIAFSERADFLLDDLNMVPLRGRFELPRLAVASDGRGSVTVLSLSNVKSGALLCEVFGEVSLFEELDRDSVTPKFTQYVISGTPLMIDSTKYEKSVVYTRIRRSLYYNCEIRLFTLNNRVRVGLFATSPSILPSLFEHQKKTESTVIKSGDELFLPFDVAPVIQKYQGDWRTTKGRKMEMDMDIFRPTRSPIVTVANAERAAREKEMAQEVDRRKHIVESIGSLTSFFDDSTPFFFEITSDDDPDAPPPPRRAPKFISKLNQRGIKPFLRPEPVDPVPTPSFWYSSIRDPGDFEGPTEKDLL